jgi:arylformamidase
MALYREFETQAEIDAEYNPRLSRQDAPVRLAECLAASERVRNALPHRAGIAYGPTDAETVDIYPAGNGGSPVHVFIHGGYWHAYRGADFALVAEALVRRGITVVLVDHALCPAVPFSEIVRQCRAALAWTFHYIAGYGGDPANLTVSGHSAGGHLAAMLLATDWSDYHGIPDQPIRGALTMSGLYDLGPFPWSWLQPKLQLSAADVARYSPALVAPTGRCPVVVAVGELESREFRRQSAAYAARLRDHGVPVRHREVPGRDHFTILDDFRGEGGPLADCVAALADVSCG